MDLQAQESRRLAALLLHPSGAEPPPELRALVLRRHRLRRAVRPVVGAAALLVCVISIWLGLGAPVVRDELAHWQARSMQLEADWQQHRDPSWLSRDARAQSLLESLQQVDRDLARLHSLDEVDRQALSTLWRTRSDILSALVDSRRQGGTAMRI